MEEGELLLYSILAYPLLRNEMFVLIGRPEESPIFHPQFMFMDPGNDSTTFILKPGLSLD